MGDQISAREDAIFTGKDITEHDRRHCREVYKMAEPIEMLFTLWTRVGQWKHYYVGCTLAQPGEYH